MSDAEPTATDGDADGRSLPLAPVLGLFALYLCTVIGGVLLADPFQAAGVPTFEDPNDVSNVGIVFVEIVVFTVLFVLITRYDRGQQVLRGLIVLVFSYATYLAVVGAFPGVEWIGLAGIAAALLTLLALVVHPEWYVLDAVAVVAGAAIIAQLGNGLGPLPVFLFLVGMAIYDAYAVYVSEHMQKVGGSVGEMRIPMVYVVPTSLPFSMDDLGDPFEEPAEGEETERPILLGLGDAIVPGLLAVSGGQFLRDAPTYVEGTVLNAPAIGALVGSIAGFVGLLVLLYLVERAHAGLPVLNTCVILGYLAGAVYAGIPITTAVGL